MSLDDIWDEPIDSLTKSTPTNDESSPLKRPRQSLFLPDSGSDNERPSKRVTPAPAAVRPDIDSLFEDLDKDEQDENLRYKPLAPSLDLEKLAKEAEAKHARARRTAHSQTLTGGDDTSKDQTSKAKQPADGEKSGRRVLLKLDEERLVGPEGFPSLIENIKGFQPKGKGNEHADLNRLLQVYQFWTHRMYPKTSFKDTINRVEKLCHSKRMQVRLSVWRDEFKGVTKAAEQPDNPDVIDLTDPTLVGTEENGKDEFGNPQLQTDQTSSRAPSLPPTSSEAGDDDFDIDAVIKAEEERLAALRVATVDSESSHVSNSPTLAQKAPCRNEPDTNTMDVDEASLWEAFDDPGVPELLHDARPSAAGDDDDIWDIIDETLQEEQERKLVATGQIPLSGVNVQASSESTNNGNTVRATNDDDWDEMYT